MPPLPELRCPQCHRLLLKGLVILLEIVCPRCHTWYRIGPPPWQEPATPWDVLTRAILADEEAYDLTKPCGSAIASSILSASP